ncbi:hypothetical protein K456DRAFT_1905189 [Colletotrichum gloeosporioides 23]|nr:hypothetical protein K456DRAFT_1905189 [Colletotrichum gloeosporioides 23]
MAYDRDEFVRLLTDDCNFCNRVFWNATKPWRPPSPPKRNDTVLDLLRCIPYIDSPSNSLVLVPSLMKDTSITDYRSEDCIEGLVTPITGQDPPLPPSCAVIAICRGRNGYEWRLAGFNVHEPAEFFALCKKRYRELNWIGLRPSNMSAVRRNMNWEYESESNSDSDPEDYFNHNKIARKMKKAGSPGDGDDEACDSLALCGC